MVKVALIGCGTMGRVHCGGYKKISGVQLVAVCDLDSAKMEALNLEDSTRRYLSFEEMMAQEEFDILDICLPTYLHKEYAVQAMRAKKHVFCEKPIALTNEDAQAMIDCARENDVKFSVGQVLRFFPMYANAAQQAKMGRLGVPRLIRTTRNQGFPQWSWQNWYQDYGKSGGPIVDLAIHDIDWIIGSFGRVKRVYAKAFCGKVEQQDHCMITLRLENGAIAHVEASWAYPKGSVFRTTFEIVGTNAQIEYDSVANAPIHYQTFADGAHQDTYLSPVHGTLEPYCAELLAFVQSVENGTPLLVTGEEAAETLRVALAALESAQTGEPIEL